MGTHYSHVTEADRILIQALVQAKLSGREIGRQLNLSPSCISRELNRGKPKPTALSGSYQAGVAHVRARARRVQPGVLRRKFGAGVQSPLWRTVFFCDANSPWQRGPNENANGLIREFRPKGMDLSTVSHQQLTAMEHSLNLPPRKILGFLSPQEVFSTLKQKHLASVALQAGNRPVWWGRIAAETYALRVCATQLPHATVRENGTVGHEYGQDKSNGARP